MCQHCDDLLKAARGGDDIWRPHESPFVRELIEKWTSHGMEKFGGMHSELLKWIAGVFYHQTGAPVQKPGQFIRWNPGELKAARFYLESLDPAAYTLDDWMMTVDYLMQKYLPQDVVIDEAKWQVAKAHMMGRIEASVASISVAAANKLLDAVPASADAIAHQFGMTRAQSAALRFGQEKCCQYVTSVTEGLRRQMKLAIIGWQEARFLGVPSATAKRSLEGTLLDNFATANRDWRRIAITEGADNSLNGMIAALPPGTVVKRVEQYHGACPFCQSIDGREFTVVSPDQKDKDGDTHVWVGKTNVDRSSSPKKQTLNGLVPRTKDELWWVPAGPAHPHCRGRWLRIVALPDGFDPKLQAWLKTHYQGKK